MRLKFVISLLILFSITFTHGQSKNALVIFKSTSLVADEFYANMDYRSALHFYNKALEKNASDEYTKLRVADCYLKLNDSKSAERWYAELASSNQDSPDILLKYAEVLRLNGNLDGAAEYYERVLKIAPSPEIESKLDFIKNLGYYQDSGNYSLTNLELNSEQSDFSPQLLQNGVLFLSSRNSENFIQHQPSSASNDDEGMLRYYFSSGGAAVAYDNGEKLKASFHDGPLCIYNNEQSVAYTRNNLKEGVKAKGVSRVNLKIFFAQRGGDNVWTNQQPFKYNSEEYSCGHPTLNESGNLLIFSSDMPGGFGGSDLYVSKFENGEWSEPKNLGPEINTSGSELFPQLTNENVLHFASVGHGGFGGLDIFKSVSDDGSNWSKPINIGAPINSESDDFAIIINQDGRSGYFSSNRPGGKGLDDIYEFKMNEQLVLGQVSQKQNESVRLANAQVIIKDVNNKEVANTVTDSLGIFRANLPFDADFQVTISKQDYSTLLNEPLSTKEKKDTVSLALWKHDLFVKGRLFSNETQGLLANVKIDLKNLTTGVTETVVTGNDGSYSFPLTPNNRYEVTATVEGYLNNGYKLNTANIFKGELLNDILLEEVYVDKLVTFFDFNDSKLKNSYNGSLQQLLRTLRNFPESILIITAHADARGTIEYNKNLSQKRVDAVQAYFVSNGISKSRINGTAFGEALLLNQCSDGVECGEEDHSQNRRAELKVQMSAVH